MVKTNDEERQKKYEDKISLRSLLLRDIDRINKALLSEHQTGVDAIDNLLSDLPEDIYRSVIPKLNEITERHNKALASVEETFNERMNHLGSHPDWRRARRTKNERWLATMRLKLTREYVRKVKKTVRWTMDEFGLGLEEEGHRVDEGGLNSG